ncbi:hypothetical protein F4560_005393 [Saccharothrix ecbatanensis]|uniref:Secreted protein n=1 Tax=Saccharothrix ecbatanensis TaxID=1105145 RepID=A0A7W9HNY8_9PSEU|nr:hypothetical protein [Saccharothrix ecbatanensis]MBB5805625.1 hypothetical protein [Saccharothrix ecbatanensis]
MIKRLLSALFAVVAAAGLLFAAAPTALASNASTNGCTTLWVEYTTSGGLRSIHWAEARNICGTYWGFHNVGGVTGPTHNQGSFRVNYGGVGVAPGNYICAESWQHVSGTHFNRVGAPCTLIA